MYDILISSLLKFNKDELPWFSSTFCSAVKKIKDFVKLFNHIATKVAEYGTIDDVAMLEIEHTRPRQISWNHSKWPSLFQQRAIPLPSDKVIDLTEFIPSTIGSTIFDV